MIIEQQPYAFKPVDTGNLLANAFGPVFSHIEENAFTNHPNAVVQQLSAFTETYKKNLDRPVGVRETACLSVQHPLFFNEIQETDLFAGRHKYPVIGFAPQYSHYTGYYIDNDGVDRLFNDKRLTNKNRAALIELQGFWKHENDNFKIRAAYPPEMKKLLYTDDWLKEPIIAAPLYRMAGTQCDFDKLLRLGIPGLQNEIASFKQQVQKDSGAWHFYESMEQSLNLFYKAAIDYARMAKDKAKSAGSLFRRDELLLMEAALTKIATSKPKTFREAIQLAYLYKSISGTFNLGRMDEYLGDFYVADLKAGTITYEEAIRLLGNLWYLLDSSGNIWDERVIIGGKGRRNEENANELALAIIETTRRVKGVVPQLTLRFYSGQDERLYNAALDVIATGNPYPMLYNDEVNIPSVQHAFNIDYNEALNYLPFGCGEYIINHKSVGTPSGIINLLQALLATLHNGVDPPGNINTFEKLFNAYKKLVESYVEQLALQEKLEYDVVAQSADYLFFSMLYDDCIAKGVPIFRGGVRYLGGTLESYGNTNTADSLTAIKKLVFEEKKLTLEEVIEMIDANFVGSDKVWRMILDAPKYGNDDDYADSIKIEVDRHICEYARSMADKVGLHSYLIVIINNSANTSLGERTSASPDGRKAYTYMANANGSTGGADKNGVTAYLNSIVKPDTRIHAGAVQNIKFSKEMFLNYRQQTEALLKTYFEKGGAQCMINCIGRGDLENAMREPEKYTNLVVRVGGFSARFIELPREVQLEILSRTMN